MIRRRIGVIDYGVGNHASVASALTSLGHRCRTTHDRDELAACELLVLPGVGAFPAAMQALHAYGLVEFIQQRARMGTPMLGICLGMQLFADGSSENGETVGLGLIPGRVEPCAEIGWHIGWNSLAITNGDARFARADGALVYFNHSYFFQVPAEYEVAQARHHRPFAAAVRRGRILGMQFHPEKSQAAGRMLLHDAIEGLCA